MDHRSPRSLSSSAPAPASAPRSPACSCAKACGSPWRRATPTSSAHLCDETGARAFACDATRPRSGGEPVRARSRAMIGVPDVVVYNAAARASGPFVDLVPAQVESALAVERVRRLPGGAAGRPADAAARPWRGAVHRRIGERQGLSAIGAVRDGQVRAARAGPEHGARAGAPGHPRRALHHRRRRSAIRAATEPPDRPDSMLDPDAIAQNYLHVLRQPRSAWTWEMELRPWVEKF